jgi:hypothetical protein
MVPLPARAPREREQHLRLLKTAPRRRSLLHFRPETR